MKKFYVTPLLDTEKYQMVDVLTASTDVNDPYIGSADSKWFA